MAADLDDFFAKKDKRKKGKGKKYARCVCVRGHCLMRLQSLTPACLSHYLQAGQEGEKKEVKIDIPTAPTVVSC